MALNAEGRYDDLVYTNFPAAVDSWEDVMDVTADALAKALEYKAYCEQGDYASAQQVVNNDTTGQLARMKIDAMDINQIRHAVMALERMWAEDIEAYVKDQVFLDALMVGEYVHTYDAVTGIHSFIGSGENAKVLITAAYHEGDTFEINGETANAYMGGTALTNLFDGQYMYFIIDGTDLYFIGGGDTTALMPKAGGTFQGPVFYANGDSYYINGSGDAKFRALSLTGDCNVDGSITGTKVYNAVYNDYAEFFPRGEDTEPGDIIGLLDCENEVYGKAVSGMRSVGVHSNEFAHLIGGEVAPAGLDHMSYNLPHYIPVGMMGRCHCKVKGIVRRGDYIVPSDIPGIGTACSKVSDPMSVIGFAVQSSDDEGIKLVRIKLGR